MAYVSYGPKPLKAYRPTCMPIIHVGELWMRRSV